LFLILTLLASPAAQSAPVPGQSYSYTGGPQIYVVPAGRTSIAVTVRGSQGNDGPATGGKGASATATIAVTPGEVLQVMVGGRTGFNGGGSVAGAGGSGGGASDIRRPAFNTVSSCAYQLNCGLAERLIVAGGGGGGGSWVGSNGGDAGQTGSAGANGGTESTAGAGGTADAGGAAGTNAGAGADGPPGAGSLGTGGGQGWRPSTAGGSGGGGYYGGGGGGAATVGASGGGGGSSWAGGTGVTGASFTDASVNGNGLVIIDPPSAIPDAAFAFTGSTQNYTVPAGVTQLAVMLRGGVGGAGGEGDVVSGQLPVTPAQVLQIVLGGSGSTIINVPAGGTSGGGGGYNGGGSSSAGLVAGSIGGGGASDIRVDPYALEQRVVVAGGGGGSNGFLVQFGWSGAKGGAVATGEGGSARRNPEQGVGQGGLLTAGGRVLLSDGVTPDPNAPPGSSGAWLTGGSSSGYAGGGGGYYGGAAFDGGGGGSSYASVTGPDSTKQGVGNVLGQSGALFRHSRGGSLGDGAAVLTAMPIVTTGLYTETSGTEFSIVGTVNPKFLAASPKLYYSDVSAADINTGGGTVVDMVGPNAATTLAGDTVQDVSGAITGLTASTTYYYRVCAQSVAGLACGNTLPLTTAAPPGAPTAVTATPGDAQVTVSWTAPTNTGGAAITGYTVTASPGGQTCTTTGATSCIVAGLTNGTVYTFTVTATNSAGTGPGSTASNSVTPAGPALNPATQTVSGSVGSPITATAAYTTTGLTGTVSYAISPALPAGLSLNTITGVISGTPTATQTTATFTVTGTGASSGTATATIDITILATQAIGNTPGGPVTATITGGACLGYQAGSTQFTVPTSPPAGETFPYGVFGFTALRCGLGGTVTITLTYPQPLPAETRYWKNISGTWVDWTGKVTITGNTVVLTITDGGEGDTNPNAGEISDPSGPTFDSGPTPIPTLSEWAMLLLSLLIGGLAWRQLAQRTPRLPR